MGDYSSGDVAALPAGVDNLEHVYDGTDLAAVATAGDSNFVSQTATAPEIPVHQYKDTVTGTTVDITWTGQSDQNCADYPATLQVYKFSTTTWEDLATNNTQTANNNFTLQKLGQATTGYVDGSNVLTCRVYQSATIGLMRTILLANTNLNLNSTNGTYYFSPQGYSSSTTTEAYVFLYAPITGTLKNLRVRLSGDPDPGSYSFTVQVNGSTTGAPSVTIGAGQTTGADTTNTIAVTAGQTISIKSVTASSPAGSIYATFSLEYAHANDKESAVMVNTRQGSLSTSATEYLTPGNQMAISTTLINTQIPAPCNGYIKNLRVYLNTAPDAGDNETIYRTFKLRVNDTDADNTAVTIAGSDTSGYTEASVAVSANDLITVTSIPTNTPAASYVRYSFVFVSDTSGVFLVCCESSGGANVSNAVEQYQRLHQNTAAWVSTAPGVTVMVAPINFTMKTIAVRLSGVPGASKSYTIALNNNGIDSGTLAVPLTGAVTGEGVDYDIVSADVSVTAGDLLCVSCTPAGTPSTRGAAVSFLGKI